MEGKMLFKNRTSNVFLKNISLERVRKWSEQTFSQTFCLCYQEISHCQLDFDETSKIYQNKGFFRRILSKGWE